MAKNNVKANIWKLYVKFEANKEFMENLSLQFFRKSTICEKENEVENVWIVT